LILFPSAKRPGIWYLVSGIWYLSFFVVNLIGNFVGISGGPIDKVHDKAYDKAYDEGIRHPASGIFLQCHPEISI